ncbi:F-box protein At5g07610-like [Bidens hawaiensis]|uniref:F-box protein At5g07610-like n=1 Tax=Bidens hawaiensis TaxID=980011 RepID=UPI00404916BA
MRLPDDAQVSNEVINQPNMVNTRAKTRNTLKNCFLQASTTDSNHQLTSSAELIGSNDDILTEILLWLPVTSILRFKSVSKHWRWLLSHRHFTLRYEKLPTSPGLFVNQKYVPFDVEDRSSPPFRHLDFCHDFHFKKIVQSCNGLLLLCCSDAGFTRNDEYYVFNPTTKQFAIIPSVPGVDNTRKMIRFMGLAFHPTTCPRYKVVCILGSEYTYHMKIYYSETKEWKTLNINFSERRYYMSFGSGVYWNGAIHWDPCGGSLLYFDLKVEKLRKLPIPLPVQARLRIVPLPPIYFGESRGHLHLVNITWHESRFRLTVYEMLGNHSGWFVKYEVGRDPLDCYPGIQSNRYDPYGGFDIIDVVRGEEEEDTFLVSLYDTRTIVRYNVKDKSIKWLFDMTTADVDIVRFERGKIHRYIQSLTSF